MAKQESVYSGEVCDSLLSIIGMHDNENANSEIIAFILNESVYSENNAILNFGKMLDIDLFPGELIGAKTEVSINSKVENNSNKSQGGRIDIVIEFQKHVLIIENKIYSYDREGQWEKYIEFAEEKYKGREITYIHLSLFGRMPNRISLSPKIYGMVRDHFICLSYHDLLNNWLAKLEVSECSIWSAVEQYKLSVEKLISENRVWEEVRNYHMDPDFVLQQGCNNQNEVIKIADSIEWRLDFLHNIANAICEMQPGLSQYVCFSINQTKIYKYSDYAIFRYDVFKDLNKDSFHGIVILQDSESTICYGIGFEFIALKTSTKNKNNFHIGIMKGGKRDIPPELGFKDVRNRGKIEYPNPSYWSICYGGEINEITTCATIAQDLLTK